MGKLERGLSRLHWPPLVKNVVMTHEYPGYRYEFFKTFTELDEYMSKECGDDWRTQDWCRYWINQHFETKRDDIAERKFTDFSVKKSTGPRRDRTHIYKLALHAYQENPKISSYGLARLLCKKDIKINQATAWRILKKLRAHESESAN